MPHLITHFVDSDKNLEVTVNTNNYGANVIFVLTQAIMSFNTIPSLKATKFRENFSSNNQTNKQLARALKHKYH